MRIAHLINSIGLGGVPEAVYQLLKAMRSGGDDHRIFVLRRHDPTEAARNQRLMRFRDLGIDVTFPAEGVEKLGIISELASWLEAQRFDILHTHSYKPNLRGRLAGMMFKPDGLRLVAHYHNQYDANWQRDGTLTLDRLLTRLTDRIVACSNAVGDHVRERLAVDPAKLRTVANGADLERYSIMPERGAARLALGLPAAASIITLVGRISAQKGQEDAVRAMPAILTKWPDALLVLAGGVDDAQRVDDLHHLASQLGVLKSIRFLGFVSEMPALYAATDLLVAPSRWEGFGLMLVEAMAAGVPIVATRAGAIPEVTGEKAAVLVPAGDWQALADASAQVLSNPRLADSLVAAGKQRARQFSWSVAAERMQEVYGELLAGNGSLRP